MSPQPNSSTAAVSTDSRPPPQPQPPEELKRDLKGSKVIFFTLDTLFDRDFATERGLKKCKRLSPDLRGKSMDELKRAYHDGMAAAYRNHIQSLVLRLDSHTPKASTDKIELMFRELNLNPPSSREKRLIGKQFTAEFNRNRFEVAGASQTLAQLRNLEYAIVVADDDLEWDVVKDLNFWQYINANIITKDLVRRKPDRSVFKRALDACGVSPKNAVIVGRSIEEDIVGILNADAEPILYMPNHDSTTVDVRGTSVLVVRTMAELLSEISGRPENRHLVSTQHHQLPPPSLPSHPLMPHASQAQGYPNDQNGGPSSQHHHEGSSQSQRPASDPKPINDRHASQSWENAPLSRILSQPGPSKETPRRHKLPDRGHSTKYYERTAHLVPPLSVAPAKRPYEPRSEYGYVPSSSYHDQGYADHDPARGHHDPAGRPNPGPSTQTSAPHTPQLPGQSMGPRGDGSRKSSTRSSTAVYTPPNPTLPTPVPSMRMFPPTKDYGISMPTHVANQDQRRPQDDEYGHGTSRNGYSTHGGYLTQPPPPPRRPYQPPIPYHSTYREYSWVGGHGYEHETSGNRRSTRDGCPHGTPIPHQAPSPSDARHQGQYQSWNSGHLGEVQGRSYPTQDQHQAGTPSPHQAPHEMSQQIGLSSGLYDEHGRHTFARRTASMYEANSHRPWETHNARPLGERWEPPNQRGHARQDERRVQPCHGEVIDLASPTMNAVPSSQAPQSTAEDPAIPGDPSRQPSHGDSPERWSTPRPQADERYKTWPSNQKHARPMYEDTAVHRERFDEGSMTHAGSSPDTPTQQSSSSKTARADDAADEPPGKSQRTTEELREIVQTVVDLSRKRPLPRLSSTGVDERPENAEEEVER